MLTDGEISIFTDILKLQQKSCKEFTACDICPFSIDVPELETYKCQLHQALKNLSEQVFCEDD